MLVGWGRRRALTQMLAASAAVGLRGAHARERPDAAMVVWGGVGFGVSGGAQVVGSKFPRMSEALAAWPDFGQALVASIRSSYKGIFDNPRLIDIRDDPALLIVVSLEFEQVFFIPDDGGSGKSYQVSHVYASSQVLHYEPPRPGGSDGSIVVLYSFPVRVSRVAAVSPGRPQESVENLRRLLIQDETRAVDSLAGLFAQTMSSKGFRRQRIARMIAVTEVRFSDAMTQRTGEFGLQDVLTAEFFGQAMTASLGSEAGASVIPFGQTDTLSARLAARFDQFQVFGDLIQSMKSQAAAYGIELDVLGILRKPNGSTSEKITFMRGVLVQIRLWRTPFDRSPQILFDERVRLVENTTTAKLVLDNVIEYDRRYFTQLVIALFDRFVSAVINADASVLEGLGIERGRQGPSIGRARDAFLSCRYDAA